MPGLSLYYSRDTIEAETAKRLEIACGRMILMPGYSCSAAYEGDRLRVYKSGYENYPFTEFEIFGYQVTIEGRIYELSTEQQKQLLGDIALAAFSDRIPEEKLQKLLASKLAHLDGDYNLIIIDQASDDFLLVNDSFGKLILFHDDHPDRLTISREVKFIRTASELNQLNKFAAAQMLMLKFVTGGETLINGISRMPHASYFLVRDGNLPQAPEAYYQWDLSENDFGKSLKDHSAHLVEMFYQAIKNRQRASQSDPSVLGLSGGLDSRAVLAGLDHCGINYQAASSVDFHSRNLHDVEVAEVVSKLYGQRWERIDLSPVQIEDYLRQVNLRDGLNTADMAVAHEFYRYICDKYGWGVDFYTGDGGAHIKTAYRFLGKLRDARDIINYGLNRASFFKNEEVERLLNIKMSDLEDKYVSIIESYPGRDWQEKYYYYIVFDRRIGFFYEGEERTRGYFWTVAPFEAQPFYSLALQLPDSFKSDFRLFIRFLHDLDPRLLEVQYADLGYPISSRKAIWKMKLKSFLQSHPALLKFVRKRLYPKVYSSFDLPCFNREVERYIKRSKHLPDIIDPDKVLDFIKSNVSAMQYYSLLSLVLYSQITETGGPENARAEYSQQAQ